MYPDVLKRGGNAADAAVAIAAALAVTEPCSTGLGGDAFCLFFNSVTGEIRGINGRSAICSMFLFCLHHMDEKQTALFYLLFLQWSFSQRFDSGIP